METMKKKYHYPADLKLDLLEKGIEIIQEKGIDGLTLKNLAGSLGVTSAAMYHHYPDKTALLATIAEKRLDELYEVLEEKAKLPFITDPVKLLVKGSMVFYDFCEENTEFLPLMISDAIHNWSNYPAIEEKIRRVINIPLDAIKIGQASGDIRSDNVESLMMMMFAGVLGFVNIAFNSKIKLSASLKAQSRSSFFELVSGNIKTLKDSSNLVMQESEVFEKTFIS